MRPTTNHILFAIQSDEIYCFRMKNTFLSNRISNSATLKGPLISALIFIYLIKAYAVQFACAADIWLNYKQNQMYVSH